MTPLYKSIKGRLHYWEAWKRNTKIWAHSGWLGHWGRVDKLPMNPGETEKRAIARYTKELAVAKGYAPLEAELKQLVVQYAIEVENTDFREEIYGILNNNLGWTGNGSCDGGDIGSGTVNLFCDVVDPALAVKSVVIELKKAKRLDGAVLATRVGSKFKVLWPKGSRTPFSLMGKRKKRR